MGPSAFEIPIFRTNLLVLCRLTTRLFCLENFRSSGGQRNFAEGPLVCLCSLVACHAALPSLTLLGNDLLFFVELLTVSWPFCGAGQHNKLYIILLTTSFLFSGMVQICSSCNKTIPQKYPAYGDSGQLLPPPAQPPPTNTPNPNNPNNAAHSQQERDIRWVETTIHNYVNQAVHLLQFCGIRYSLFTNCLLSAIYCSHGI